MEVFSDHFYLVFPCGTERDSGTVVKENDQKSLKALGEWFGRSGQS